jgi:TPR repeat protein
MYANGEGGLGKDPKRAVELYQKACDGDEMSGCSNLGVRYANGEGGLAKDRKRARELFSEACRGGEEQDCQTLRRMNRGD